jgi:hypothetical protein
MNDYCIENDFAAQKELAAQHEGRRAVSSNALFAFTIMKPEMIALLKDLADVLERHHGGLSYTTSDDGIHVHLGEDRKNSVCVEWPMNGNVSTIRKIIEANAV